MHDAVADVLEGRERLTSGRSLTLLISAGAHLGLIALAFILANRSEDAPRERTLTIRLAGAQMPLRATSQQQATPSPAVKAAPETPKPKEATPKPAAVVPAAEPPKVKPKRTSEGESLFGRSELEAPKAAKPAPPTPSPTPPATGTGNLGAAPAVGKAGVTSLEGGPFPYNAYIDRMVTLVGTHWFRPQAGGDPVAQLYFVIERSGRVRDAKVERSSGDATFDRAALRAIIESSPLPPLPLAYDGTYLGVHLTFH